MIRGDVKTRIVSIDNKPLSPKRSLKLVNHSPDGFAWGYNGSGPSQLALAILLEFAINEDVALYAYQDFKREVIADMPMDSDFGLDEDVVIDWLAKHTDMSI